LNELAFEQKALESNLVFEKRMANLGITSDHDEGFDALTDSDKRRFAELKRSDRELDEKFKTLKARLY
jgi:hypothetical protein